MKELVKKIQVDGYQWKPRMPTLELLHGAKGVKGEPFTNLTYASRDINQLESGISASLKHGKITQEAADEALKIIRKDIQDLRGIDLDKAIIKRQFSLAKKLEAGTFQSYEDLNKSLRRKLDKVLKKNNIKLSNSQKGAMSIDLLKDIGKLGPKGLRLLASDWVWPEIVIGWLDKQNNIQKGMSEERASSEMWKNMTFGGIDLGGTENAILGQLKKLGYGEKDIKAAEHMMRYGKLSKEIEKTKTGIESMELGMAEQGSAEGVQQLREKLENLKKEQESVAGFYFGAIGDKDPNYGYELYDQASKELMRTEWNKSLEGRKKRIDPYAGGIGDVVQSDVFSIDAWLPQHFLGATKSKSTLAREKIAAMSDEEHLQKGIGYERVHPQYGAAMSDKQMEPLRDQMDYMYAGGGMVGIRKPHAIPPERQGLRSIMIGDMDD